MVWGIRFLKAGAPQRSTVGVRFTLAAVSHDTNGPCHRLHDSPFLWFLTRILGGNPEKELQWSL